MIIVFNNVPDSYRSLKGHHAVFIYKALYLISSVSSLLLFSYNCSSGSHIENWHSVLRNGLVNASYTKLQVCNPGSLQRTSSRSVNLLLNRAKLPVWLITFLQLTDAGLSCYQLCHWHFVRCSW